MDRFDFWIFICWWDYRYLGELEGLGFFLGISEDGEVKLFMMGFLINVGVRDGRSYGFSELGGWWFRLLR